MEDSSAFKKALAFLETEFSMRTTHFSYNEEVFGNIFAEYANDIIRIKIVRDRGLVETEVSSQGRAWRTLDSLLQEMGLPLSVQVVYKDSYDSFGHFNGNTLHGQAAALQSHLHSIIKYLAGA